MENNQTQTYRKRYDVFVDGIIKQAEDKARAEYDIDAIAQVDREEAERRLFLARSKAVKSLNKAIDDRLLERYEQELTFSEDNKFQIMGWIIDNKGVMKNIKKYPLLLPLLDYIYNLNRRGLKHIESIGYAYDDKPASVFKADKMFYSQISKSLKTSERTVKRYIKGLMKIDVIREVETLKSNVKVLSDGYFDAWDNGFLKRSYLKDSKKSRDNLKQFKPQS